MRQKMTQTRGNKKSMTELSTIFWAKSGDKDHPSGHPLLAHLLDAAAMARVILLREPPKTRRLLADALGLSEEEALNFAAFAVGLHDLGKASAVFEKQWEPGMQRLQARGLDYIPLPGGMPWVAHGALTEVLVTELLSDLGFSSLIAEKLGLLLGAHHGFLAPSSEVDDKAFDVLEAEIGPWDEARRALLNTLWETLGRPRPATDDLSPDAALWLMGLTSFADWLASSPEFFPYGRDIAEPGRYFENALALAEKALDDPRVRWEARTPLAPEPPPFKAIFPFSPNALQSAVAESLKNVREPSLLILEAPMGGGKTEAAFYAHLLLQAQNGHRGLYVAMPTQATGNAMFDRVKDFLAKFGDRPHDLQLVHGAAILKPEYVKLREVGEVVEVGESTVRASEWFSAKKRAMLTEYGVGTVDQALLGVLKVRHHFVRLWGLGNRTLVFDEVHAYDAYTSRLIAGLIRWMKALGSSVVLMSATLTRAQRARLAKAWGAKLPEAEAPYPRLTLVRGGFVKSIPIPWEEEKTYRVAAAPRPAPELADFALERLGKEGAAALIVNTVDRAQALYQELKARLGSGEVILEEGRPIGWRTGDTELYLLHARLPSAERQVRESVLLARFGKDGKRPKRALVVATQVIEQSLDLDFDL
ncbi:MAG TPA: CRISPR-associated helicase Cas3', partial [Oceanithermus sp.]|nr:CRISPR-associated helicase Cas3' [Oceanithermus sp.]